MNGKPFFDTNILVYALVSRRGLPADPRTRIAEELLTDGGFVSVQVLSEFCDVLWRRFGLSWQAVGERLETIAAICGEALPLTANTHRSAVAISKRHTFRIYDSLILAAAAEAGCATLLTEDLQHGQTIEGVQIVNPFL